MSSYRSRVNEALRGGRVILASSSPRRREILEHIGLRFQVEKPGYDEAPVMRELARPRNALIFGTHLRKKLKSVILGKYHSLPKKNDHVVFCFDTVVHEGHQVMGKPGSYDAAFEMLRLLNGERHWVVTICLAAFAGKVVLNFF
ncbi:MAG: Maf family protein, partial [Spirochaetia bacterium]|nr:Maf family protein [Spirochaetia bacterium]